MVPTEITSCTDSGGAPLDIVGYVYPTAMNTSSEGTQARAPFWTIGVFATLLLVGTGGSISAASTSAVVERSPGLVGRTKRMKWQDRQKDYRFSSITFP